MRRKILLQTATHRIVKRTKRKRGGKRSGSGRPKGSKSRKTILMDKYISEVMDAAVAAGDKKPSALAIYQALYTNPNVPEFVRRDAMARALPYEDARRKASEFSDPNGGHLASRFETARDTLKGKLIATPRPVVDQQVDRQSDSDRGTGTSV